MGVHSSVICGKKQVEDVGRDEMVSWTACICWHLWCLAGYVQVPYAQFMTSLYNCAAMCCTGRSQTKYTIVTFLPFAHEPQGTACCTCFSRLQPARFRAVLDRGCSRFGSRSKSYESLLQHVGNVLMQIMLMEVADRIREQLGTSYPQDGPLQKLTAAMPSLIMMTSNP